MRLGVVEMTYALDCKCGHRAEGGTHKRAYFWLALHLRLSPAHRGDRINLPRVLWELFRWRPVE